MQIRTAFVVLASAVVLWGCPDETENGNGNGNGNSDMDTGLSGDTRTDTNGQVADTDSGGDGTGLTDTRGDGGGTGDTDTGGGGEDTRPTDTGGGATIFDTCVPHADGEELCDTPFDDDCDGLVNEACGCNPEGATQECYPGDSDHLSVEATACATGTQRCELEFWNACSGYTGPALQENCDNELDDDCDGRINEGCVTDPPTIICPDDFSGPVLRRYDIQAAYFDPSGSPLVGNPLWQLSPPIGSSRDITFDPVDKLKLRFFADVLGDYTFSVTVQNQAGFVGSCSTTFTATSSDVLRFELSWNPLLANDPTDLDLILHSDATGEFFYWDQIRIDNTEICYFENCSTCRNETVALDDPDREQKCRDFVANQPETHPAAEAWPSPVLTWGEEDICSQGDGCPHGEACLACGGSVCRFGLSRVAEGPDFGDINFCEEDPCPDGAFCAESDLCRVVDGLCITEQDPRLDLDDINGGGPENINIRRPDPGTYRLAVHYFDDGSQDGTPFPGDAIATVRIVCGESEWVAEGASLFVHGRDTLRDENDLWEVGELTLDYINNEPVCDFRFFGDNLSDDPCYRICRLKQANADASSILDDSVYQEGGCQPAACEVSSFCDDYGSICGFGDEGRFASRDDCEVFYGRACIDGPNVGDPCGSDADCRTESGQRFICGNSELRHNQRLCVEDAVAQAIEDEDAATFCPLAMGEGRCSDSRIFCEEFDDVCGFGGANFEDEEACTAQWDGLTEPRQQCVLQHLDLSRGDADTHCPHAQGAGPCENAAIFCDRYEDECGFGGDDRHADSDACVGAYNGYDPSQQTCVESHLDLVISEVNPAEHCPHATAIGQCE